MNQICEAGNCKYFGSTGRLNEWYERNAPGPWWDPKNMNMDPTSFTLMILASLKMHVRMAEYLLSRGRTAGQDWEKAALDAENYLHKCIAELEGRGG